MSGGVHLIGGGWDPAAASSIYGPFLAEAEAGSRSGSGSGPAPTVACLVLDEGDGREQFQRWAAVLVGVAPCRPIPLLVPIGSRMDPAALDGADALLVCGGLTPGYAAAVAPVADQLRGWLTSRPYCGFSAGAVISASSALTGGWQLQGRPLVPEDAGEDLYEITSAPGLSLVQLVVDVHAGQWGTLPRLLAAVQLTGTAGIAVDENTVVSVVDGLATVGGLGHVHLATPAADGVLVRRYSSGATFPVG